MKLNGWKRIGIIASVVWIVGAGYYTVIATSDADAKFASGIRLDCETYIPAGIATLAECDKRGDDWLKETASSERIEAASVALVPVPLTWGFTYLVLFLVRWVKRAFMRPF